MKVLSFDTETTGLPVKSIADDDERQPWIIQLGAVLYDLKAKEKIATYDVLVNPPPSVVFHPKALEVNGLKEEDIRGKGVPPHEAMITFETLVRNCDLVIAYNLPFDAALVRYTAARSHAHFQEFPILGEHVRSMCVMQQAIGHFGHRLKLGNVYRKLFGVDFEGAHTALADAEAALDVWKYLTAIQLQRRSK